MSVFSDNIFTLIAKKGLTKQQVIQEVSEIAVYAGYTLADIDDSRPWAGFVRLAAENGDDFTRTYFRVDPIEARQGDSSATLSPKILYVESNQRLSWQRHQRRSERWAFLTDGFYYRSQDANNPGEPILTPAGTEVQFVAGECHRLMGYHNHPTFVAEI